MVLRHFFSCAAGVYNLLSSVCLSQTNKPTLKADPYLVPYFYFTTQDIARSFV